jgi:hypothetical protein
MPKRAPKIYVEIEIGSPLEPVWHLTQTPDLHQQWDLRFTQISYLPRPDPSQPQRFLYATRIGFGLRICGEGESVGNFDASNGSRSSALKFWSEDPKSLIRQGSGYWKYIPLETPGSATRFLTLYDYDVRFGSVGRVFDRIVFRPLIGWATAWSFDRLRLWIEKGISPAASLRHSIAYAISRFTVAFVWIYQGLVPKLMFRNADELAMLHRMVTSDSTARRLCVAIGIFELGLGLTMVFLWRSLAPLWFTLAAMLVATAAVAVQSPRYLTAAFNPVSLNASVFALAAVALLLCRDLPCARRCIRRFPGEQL